MRLALPILLLAACAEAPADRSASPPPDPIADSRVAPRVTLVGSWTVVALDGSPPDAPIGLTGTGDRLFWEPDCARQGLDYDRGAQSGVIRFVDPDAGRVREVCDIGYPESLPSLWSALEGERRIDKHGDGSVTIAGEGHRVVLRPLAAARRGTLAGEWRVARIDGEPLDELYGIAVSANRDTIWIDPRCVGAVASYVIEDDRFFPADLPAPPPLPPGVEAPPPPVCAVKLPPAASDAIGAIRAANRIERTPSNGVRLYGNGRSITLFSQ